MKILYVTQVPLERTMGGTRHVLGVVRGLTALGHEVCLLAPGTEAEPLAGVRRVRPPRFLRPGARMEVVLAGLAAKEVLQQRPDVAYVRLSASSSAVVTTLVSFAVPVVLELNGRITEEMRLLNRGELRVLVTQSVIAGLMQMARHTVASAPTMLRYAREVLGATRVSVIDNGTDLETAKPGDRGEARRALGLPEELRLITLVGTLAPELRLDLLAEAHRSLVGVGLLVVGDGPQADFVHAMAMAARPSSPVLFVGPKPHPEAVRAIQAADICVNVRDGDLGMRGVEYAAVGRRQVAFRVEGSERLEQLYPGLDAVHLVETRTAAALAEALRRALDAEKRLGPLPAEAIERVRSQVGWKRTAEEIAELLESIVGSR